MNIEYLKYFAELAKLQHYGKAAKALNISQPGLSHAIKTLEDEYGVPLFQKEGRNVSLSRYGKELMQDVEEILDAYLRMEERAAGLRTEEKTVRIGTVYPLAAGTIPHMLREFGATFPFIIYNRLTPEIEEGLLDGKYDIGFCSELLKSEELEYYPLRESYIAAAVPEGHPLEGKENITLKEAAKYPQVMFSRTSGFRSLQEQIFAEQGIQVKSVCEAEEIEVITALWKMVLEYLSSPTWTSSASITSPQSRCRPQAGNQNSTSPEENTESAQRRKRRFFSIGGNDGQEILWYSKTKSK